MPVPVPVPVPGFAEQLFHLADQLRRASTSISFNIAEGAGEYAPADKARFYRIARRSATESAAILDACRLLSLIDADRSQAMLTAMVVKLSGAGSGSDLATNLR